METIERARPDPDGDEEKLVPEWTVGADDQIVLAGVAVFAALLLIFGWNAVRSGDDDIVNDLAAPVIAEAPAGALEIDPGPLAAGPPVAPIESAVADTVPEVATTQKSVASSTVRTLAVGNVQSDLLNLPGAITAMVDGSVVTLTGFVLDQAERVEAEQVAAAVAGVERVQNDLVLLDEPVLATLAGAGVLEGAVAGSGTSVTVSGTIQSEEARTVAFAAAASVEGVTDVTDALTVSVAADLNELPQVQFATSSAEILPESFADLDTAVELVAAAGEIQLEVRGFTDTRGSPDDNLRLSQDRADAVRLYLVDAGVDEAALSAIGFGETDQFAAGDSAEALLANRVVLFEQVG